MILHVDMDAFYAAIEQRDDPALRGKPVIVGGTSPRGVVATASYEARVFGVRSAMPSYRARALCPDGIWVRPRMSVYVAVSAQLMAIFEAVTPSVEPLSLDEAFLDLAGTERLLGDAVGVARRLAQTIEQTLGLTASIGVAANKFVAKVASDLHKPSGITVCEPGREAAFLAPLPLQRLWGVGPKTAAPLLALGLHTIGDVASCPPAQLVTAVGRSAAHLQALARGEDARRVVPDRTRHRRGAERTLATNIEGPDAVRRALLPLVDEVAAGLRRHGLRAGGVQLKVKYADFQQVTRESTLPAPTNQADGLLLGLERLMARVALDRSIRLVGLAAYDLREEDAPRQLTLFGDTRAPATDADTSHPAPRDRAELSRTLDAVEERFGQGSVQRGSALRRRPSGQK